MILATAGHIDHGKTALVRALTGVDGDRLPEEKRRGLTIDLGFAYTTLPDGTELGFVDVPGHERFLPNMLAGVLSIDRVLLIVAADDGPRPQTLEHLEILELIGVAEISGVVTKIDRAAPERTATVVAQVAELLAESGYPQRPVFPVSSRTSEGISALAAHLAAAAAASGQVQRKPRGYFRMPIDRAFSMPGSGPVVTGTIVAGSVAAGDRLSLGDGGILVRVRGVHAQNRPVERAVAGERCAVNVIAAFPEGGEPRRGDWLCAPQAHAPVSRIDVAVTVSRALDAPLRDGLPVHAHLGTADAVARAVILGARSLAPGESGFVQLDLEHTIGALHGDRVVLRDHAARRSLAGGRVVDPFPARRGRSRPARLAMLAVIAEPDAAMALRELIEIGGTVELAAFARARNLTQRELDAIVEAGAFRCVGRADNAVAVSPERLARLGDQLVAALAAYHRRQPDMLGLSRTLLFCELRHEAPEAALDAALAALIEAGQVVREGAVLRLADHRPRLSREDERLWEKIAPLLAQGELRPPRVRELAAALLLQPEAALRFLKRMERFGRVAQVADNRFFPHEALARLAAIACSLAQAAPEAGFTAQNFKDSSGVGRNLTIEILEYFDRTGLTRRQGDFRTMLRVPDPAPAPPSAAVSSER